MTRKGAHDRFTRLENLYYGTHNARVDAHLLDVRLRESTFNRQACIYKPFWGNIKREPLA